MALLAEVGALGLVDRDINGPPPKPGLPPRGPFDKVLPSPTATFPSLWNHDAKNETRMVCDPDSQLQVRQGMEKDSEVVWDTASRTHLNRDFTFGSQALAIAFTDKESIGGRVWPNVIFPIAGLITPSQCGGIPHWVCCPIGGIPAVSNRAKQI